MSEIPAIPKLDIEAELENVARGLTEADAARVRTLIYLASRQQAAVIQQAPLTDREYIDRLVPLLKAAGRTICQLAFGQAFKKGSITIDDEPQNRLDPDVELPTWWALKVKKIRTLRQLYKAFPAVKRPGFPPGYPSGRSIQEKQDWVQREAKRLAADAYKRNIPTAMDGDAPIQGASDQ